MKLDHIENVAISLDTLKGLEETINDLLEANVTLFTEYPSSDKVVKFRANRLADKLLALASAMIATNKATKQELRLGINALLKGGEK
ncbi:hypothetical protein [Limosilactobacillus reuteri]|uniref:hypothetical protein n=1 Tax=Limosilactobacillus reuteri TaxID=1598 RepID=UPI001E52A678|nr:hypothetical protein [Limosilactobacillus reuteri]MCC4499953.1 hypothetical protein [Limosilactobacillus reuteri]MCC4504287.1 hypothetical protein [Limosilactobacillus reuteri]MCC4506541.1 hypothetical protein [Limosilactobacillus reuteri]